ncbi:MAG: restriction endonuclease subunit S [Treponema sp.]|nr:restriction endonuclease subunit S [Treponema sp.]
MTAKALKNALLQEAVQGKLVPQIASEGNARDLLEEIRKERLSHGLDFANAKSGKRKSKKETALAGSNPCDITEEEIPFDIPENWCWCRLGEIVSILGDGIHGTPNYDISGNYYFVNGNNLNNGKIEIKPDTKKVNQSEYEKYKKELNNNTVFVSINGTLGNIAFYENEKIILGKSACYFNLIKNEMKIYIYWLIKTKYFLDYANEEATGTTIKNVSLAAMRNFPIPLPPLAEQKRIVAAIEKFMPFIEEYGKKETELKAINEKIGTLTKKAILQEAVQGKLVPQIASEGNARDLLEEIRKEKLSHGLDFANAKSGKKKSKKETALAGSNPCDIKEDEIPFDIPENWCWCRLGEIVYNNGQKTPDKEFSYIDIGSIDNLHQKLNDKENFVSPEQAPSRARKIVKKGDIIYATVRPYLHNMCIIDKDFEKEPIASTGFAVLACYPQINNQYLFYYLLSPSFDNYANDTENSKGVAYPAINDDKLYKGVVPLPPLAEQKRIVAAIEKMLPFCEKLGE